MIVSDEVEDLYPPTGIVLDVVKAATERVALFVLSIVVLVGVTDALYIFFEFVLKVGAAEP